MANVKVKNRATGVESELTAEQYAKVQNDPLWLDVFSVVSAPAKPNEVKDLEAKHAVSETGTPKQNGK